MVPARTIIERAAMMFGYEFLVDIFAIIVAVTGVSMAFCQSFVRCLAGRHHQPQRS